MPRLSIEETLKQPQADSGSPREGFDVNKFQSKLSEIQAERQKVNQQTQTDNIGTGFDPTFERVEGEGFGKSALKTVGNIPRSAFELGRDVVGAVTSPIETSKSIFNLIKGSGGKIGEASLEKTEIGQKFLEFANTERQKRGLPPLQKNEDGVLQAPETPEMQVANAVGTYFSERYGSIENFKESTVEDPVGVLSDIASVVSGGGAVLKQTGNISRINRLSDVGGAITRAGDALEPVTATQRGLGAVGRSVSQSLPGRVVGEAAPTPGRFAEGEIVKALELTQGDVRRISQNTGNDVADFVVRNELLKETPEEIAKATDTLKNTRYNQVRDEIAQVSGTYNKTDVPQVNDALSVVRETVDGVPGLEDVATEVNRLLEQDSYSLSDIQRAKEILDANTNIYTRSGDVRGAATAQGLSNIRQELRSFIEDEVTRATNGETNIRRLNNDVATSRELIDAIELRETRDLTRNYAPLTSTLMGGAAFAGTGDIYTAIGVAAAAKMAQTPSFRIALARLLKATPAQDLRRWSSEVAEGNLSPQTRQALTRIVEEAKQNVEFIEAGSQIISEAEEPNQ